MRSGLPGGSRILRQIFSDWHVSAVRRYQSGALISAPMSNHHLGAYLAGASTQHRARIPDQPLYPVNSNGKIDPAKQLILNPAAWTECGPTARFGCGASTLMFAGGDRLKRISAWVGGRQEYGGRGEDRVLSRLEH